MKEILLKVQYLEKLHEILNDLPFLPEKIKIEKVEKLVGNLHGGNEFSIHITNLKEALNNGFVLKNTHRVIKFNQNAWPEPYININTDLRKKRKKWLWKRFFKVDE